MNLDIKNNELHYYLELLRINNNENRNTTHSTLYVKRLNNIVRTMKYSRHNNICNENFSKLDFGNIPLNGVRWSYDGYYPSIFNESIFNECNVETGHAYNADEIEWLEDENIIITYSSIDSRTTMWDEETGLSRNILNGNNSHSKLILSPDKTQSVELLSDGTANIWNIVNGTYIHLQKEHSDVIKNARFSSDGSIILTCSYDTAIVWNAANGEKTCKLKGLYDTLMEAAISPNGFECATYSIDGTLIIWDAKTGDCTHTLKHTESISELFLTDNHKCIISTKNVKIMDVEQEELVTEIEGNIITILDSKNSIVVHTNNNEIKVINIENGECLLSIKLKTNAGYFVCSENKEMIAAISYPDHKTEICSITDYKYQKTIDDKLIAFAPNGKKYLACSNVDHRVYLQNIVTDQCVCNLSSHFDYIHEAIISRDGTRCLTYFSGEHSKGIKIWSLKNGRCIKEIDDFINAITSVAISSNGKQCSIGVYGGNVQLWDIEKNECRFQLNGHYSDITSVHFSEDSKLCVSCSYDSLINIWNVDSGKLESTLEDYGVGVLDAVLSSDGRFCLTGSLDNTAKLWNVYTRELERTFSGYSHSVSSVAISNDCRYCLCSDDDSERIHSIKDGRTVCVFNKSKDLFEGIKDEPHMFIDNYGKLTTLNLACEDKSWYDDKKYILSFDFSKNGKLFLIGNEDGISKICDTKTHECLHEIEGYGVLFSENGKICLTALLNKTVKLWNVSTGKCIIELRGHDNYISSASLSSDNKHCLIGSLDGKKSIWKIETGECISEFEGNEYIGRVTSYFSPEQFIHFRKKIYEIGELEAILIAAQKHHNCLFDTTVNSSNILFCSEKERNMANIKSFSISNGELTLNDVGILYSINDLHVENCSFKNIKTSKKVELILSQYGAEIDKSKNEGSI